MTPSLAPTRPPEFVSSLLLLGSTQVKVGDTLDLVLSENRDKDTVAVMRVSPRRVSAETTSTDKYKVVLRRWKYVELSRDEAFKP